MLIEIYKCYVMGSLGTSPKLEPVIIVMAYERTSSLLRLLNSLNQASYPSNNILLILSLGKMSNNNSVRKVMENFKWKHGKLKIKFPNEDLSITDHYLSIFPLVEIYQNIIILEDDLFVSPVFYYYAQQALISANKSKRVAGISLNRVWFNGYTKYQFNPLKDSGDNYFMQIPISYGQVYSKSMVQKYLSWYKNNSTKQNAISSKDLIHKFLIQLSLDVDEWFPLMTKYLVDTDQYFLYPYYSLSTNFGEIGKHFSRSTTFFQIPLEIQKKKYNFTSLENSIAIYDSFQELLPSCLAKFQISNKLHNLLSNIDMDLNGTKSSRVLTKKFVLTTRQVQNAIMTYGGAMKPLVSNIISNIEGSAISLAKREDVLFSKKTDKALLIFMYEYFLIQNYELPIFTFMLTKIKRWFSYFL